MFGSLPGSPLEGELSPTFDDDNHNGVSILAGPSHMFESGENQPAGLETQEPQSAQGESVPYPMSDDEGGMLSDGGVQLNISQAHAESVDIDTHMAHPDAEETSDISSTLQNYTSLGENDNENTLGTVEDEPDVMESPWPQEHGNTVAYQISNLLNGISGLSQQMQQAPSEHPELQHIQQQIQDLQQLQTLQHVQNEQEQGEQPTLSHVVAYDQGILLLFANSFLLSLLQVLETNVSMQGRCLAYQRFLMRKTWAPSLCPWKLMVRL